jgi:glycosyltransferase involved in cell wall biosynthesis
VPVVASDRGAPREIITDGEDGCLVNPEASGVFAERIIGLLANEDQRYRMGEKGKEHVLKYYPLGAYGRKMERVYQEVLGR